MSNRRGDTAWHENVPRVTEVTVAADGQPAVSVYGADVSLRILNAALVLACRDGWADWEGARRGYIGKALDWLDDNGGKDPGRGDSE